MVTPHVTVNVAPIGGAPQMLRNESPYQNDDSLSITADNVWQKLNLWSLALDSLGLILYIPNRIWLHLR
jgi:hypothetical protein